jgi:hypothetical protein
VTASTPALLKRFAAHGRGVLLENCVPASFLEVPHEDSGGTDPLVGWAGTMQSHPRDLDAAGTGVRDAGVRFTVVGDPAGVGERLGIGPLETERAEVPFNRWPHEVARLEVGIAPLAGTKFNRAKSWLKPLEYAACGVPCVASPVEEYRRFAQSAPAGVGTSLAVRPRDWQRALQNLRNPNLRADCSTAARENVRLHHTYERNGWRWAEAWAAAAEHGP